jgi:hypothetical protein
MCTIRTKNSPKCGAARHARAQLLAGWDTNIYYVCYVQCSVNVPLSNNARE